MRSPGTFLTPPSLAVLILLLLAPSVVTADTRVVRRGENLQTALNAAAPGDVLVLDAGAEFVGNFTLPVKSGDSPIIVRSAASDLLPGEGVRIQPAHVPLLARLRSPNTAAALKTAAGAHHWDLRYLEFAANVGGYGDIIQLGDGSSAQNTLARVPHHLALSHLYVHGDQLLGQKRCIALNAASVTIRDSSIFDCKGVGIDAQAIGGWNGPGPYVIENNYLEGSGENVLFGGADPAISGLVATDIAFRRNLVSRPMAWREPIIATPAGVTASAEDGSLPAGSYTYRIVARRPVGQGTIGRSTASGEVSASVGDGGGVRLSWQPVPDATEYRVYGRTAGSEGTYWTVTSASFVDTGLGGTAGAVPTGAGTVWSVKNLFELKNARSVVVEDNIFEHHWKESQPGYALVFTPRNSNGACTWCIVEDVRFEYNIVRHVAAGINLLGYDIASRPTRQTIGMQIRNNLFYDVSTAYGGGNAWFLLMGDEPRNVLVDHNTVSHNGTSLMFAYGGTSSDPREIYGVRITNNAAPHGNYGLNGEFFGYGNGVIRSFFPDGTVTSNFLAGGSTSRYPSGNYVAGSFESQFADAAAGDFQLRADSFLRGAATDGGDIGADIGAVVARTGAIAAGGVFLPAPANLRIVTK